MIISQQLRKSNIAEYILYMWQIEDIIRAYGCDLSAIRRDYISKFQLTDDQRDDMTDWYGNLIRMIREEGKMQSGHIQINQIVVQQMTELHNQLLSSPKFPFYNTEYYKVLPFIVELRSKNKNSETLKLGTSGTLAKGEIETCLDALYGVMMLRLQKKEVSAQTDAAVKEITTFIGMLSDYYKKDKEVPNLFD